MAILGQNSILHGARGLLGGMVFRTVGNRTTVSAAPVFLRSKRKKQSELQQLNRSRFREASAYASDAMRDTVKKGYYWQKARQMKLPNAYTAAITDFMRNAKVQSIDIIRYTGRAGGSIVIDAYRKDFTISEVHVTIGTKTGLEIENGKAVRNTSGKWVYKSSVNTFDPKELIIVAGVMDPLGKTMHARYAGPGEKLFSIRGWRGNIAAPRWMLEV
jgi:hypothetical protein